MASGETAPYNARVTVDRAFKNSGPKSQEYHSDVFESTAARHSCYLAIRAGL
ncbi:hypothetical protein GT037_001467 [Alternaria burnsii]|uniref:Uncharacterized protein n=1 Tax=Alternaria burnsii TaxID=1187904 RepID=A0A8H7EIA4_9PLEO|nr:uncharacterized protein GT037_001467 [Alternaria burnsii]KAF7679816.1 hypothetical protein GT037_001467 [Alternaria burnsii]